MTFYYRPLVQHGTARPDDALPLAGGPLWFTHVEALARGQAPQVIPVEEVPDHQLEPLVARRVDIAGMAMDAPRIMGILNTTPDSFSDGGRHNAPEQALAHARAMIEAGVDMIDIGGESTRPGSVEVLVDEEIARTAPVIAAIRAISTVPISIDTRKAPVAQAALDAGADLVNDVAGFTFDAALAPLCVARSAPVCLMHSQGEPETMQRDPRYDDVLLDVYDFLADRIATLEAAGLARELIVTDPGIGFGKTREHNLALLRGLALFHGLGCPILLGVSRKGFIGTIGQEPRAEARAPGSIAVGLAGLAQGVQILRVHDVAETAQALRLWQAARG
ncbi:dihydropteroate synthase [Pseudodonghicola xiamenensis]|uniref:Dihydropteroate synthase n=1 Tax=Pseudodonghicola xiamenensis TaxID=337702 RepID=A0A8J3MEC1_9RHOB|nr:dihydropteroate synthase [Pseudodonghicola xiamenensis]GHG95797.1 dihydropteroate synthase [Pseudodonghicola xiamenensis]